MVSELSRVFRLTNQRNSVNVSRNIPMLNTVTRSFSQYLSAAGQISKKKALMRWLKNIPELTGLISKVARDIMGKYHFEPINPNEKGRNRILTANKFSLDVSLRKVLFSQVIDILGLGEGFGWKGTVTEEQMKDKVKELLNSELLSRKEKGVLSERIMKEVAKESKMFQNGYYLEGKIERGITNMVFSDEDILRPRKYRYLPSSTMEVIHDAFDILSYKQVVGADFSDFNPKEIIHLEFMDFDGKVNGFTPVESIIVQLELLRQMWQNMLSIHMNGGSPDKFFILENTKVNSPEYQRIEEQLLKYKNVENKHGNMLFTGKITVEDVMQLEKMQFMDSGLYITGLLAMQWQVPRSSIPYIVGGTNTKDDTGGNSDAGYWNTIEYFQEQLAETYNTQLWIPHFGVKIVFENTHIQKELRMQTNMQLKLGNISTTQTLLRATGKQLKEGKILKMLDLNDADIEEVDMDAFNQINPINQFNNPSTLNNQPDREDVDDDQNQKNIRNKKKDEQAKNEERTGTKPIGV